MHDIGSGINTKITPELVDRAIEIITPIVLPVMAANSWGPGWVDGLVLADGLPDEGVPYVIGERTEWDPSWRDGDLLDFLEIATAKAEASHRTGLDSRIIAMVMPWLLYKGEYRYPGSRCRDGITVGTSGNAGDVDEWISGLVIETIEMLVHRECCADDSKGIKQIR